MPGDIAEFGVGSGISLGAPGAFLLYCGPRLRPWRDALRRKVATLLGLRPTP